MYGVHAVCGAHLEVRGQLSGVSVLLLGGFWGLKAVCLVWQQGILPTEPLHPRRNCAFHTRNLKLSFKFRVSYLEKFKYSKKKKIYKQFHPKIIAHWPMPRKSAPIPKDSSHCLST